MRSIAAALSCLLVAAPLPARAVERPIQYVVISFDGAHDLRQWARSRALARSTGAHFTYFLSCTFLLSRELRKFYHGPHKQAGASNVGFAQTREEVASRLSQIWTARGEGHEIASHGCGHFDGGGWSKKDWLSEFGQFSTILKQAWTENGLEGEPAGWQDFADTEIKGFRAPYLSTGPGLYSALQSAGFSYDASGVSRGVAPFAAKGGVRRFALPMIPEGPRGRRIIAMDYNLYVRHSDAKEKPDGAERYEERTLEAFREAFSQQYAAKRIPLQIGYHFTLMNGGAYWRALERFATEVCGKADVRCVSYRQLIEASGPGATEEAHKAHDGEDQAG